MYKFPDHKTLNLIVSADKTRKLQVFINKHKSKILLGMHLTEMELGDFFSPNQRILSVDEYH